MSDKLLGWLTINQMLFISHLLLVLSIILGMSYSRYQDEWQDSVEHMAELSKSHFASHSTFLSVSVAGRNYANLLMRSTIDNLKAIPNLQFVQITGVSDYSSHSLGVRYDISNDQAWRTDVSPTEISQLKNQLALLNDKLAMTPSEQSVHKKKFSYLANKATVDLAALENSINLQRQNNHLEKPLALLQAGYWLNETNNRLHVCLPLRNKNGGEIWAIVDASELSNIKQQLLYDLVKEASAAMLFSLIMIYTVTIWLVSPLKSLASSMKDDIEAIDQAALPGIKRADEIGDLARSYSSLITRLKNQLKVLQTQTETDPLTGLGSRYKYKQQATQLIVDAHKQGQQIYLMICDIDNFKRFNDSYGHTAGDNTLTCVASGMLKHVHEDELACRIGGEEFVVLLRGNEVKQLRQRMITLQSSAFQLGITHKNNAPYSVVTLSAGAAPIVLENGINLDNSQKALRASFIAADNALYQAKNNGRNRILFHNSDAAS